MVTDVYVARTVAGRKVLVVELTCDPQWHRPCYTRFETPGWHLKNSRMPTLV